MALLQPKLDWRVRWDGVVWTSVTDLLDSVNVRHGAATGNPDRPTILSGTGRAVMRGTLTEAQRSGRYHMHLFLEDPDDPSVEYDIWGGFIAAPRVIPGVIPRNVWRIEGHHSELLGQPITQTIPTRTLFGIMSDDGFWNQAGGRPTVVGRIPDRATREFDFSGRVGGFLAVMAATGSWEVTEDHDGDIHMTTTAPTADDIPDTTETLDWRKVAVFRDVVTRDRADRIRNVLLQGDVQLYRNTDSAIAWGARTLEVPSWWASVSLVSEARAVIDSLAELRREHTVRIPLAQRSADAIRFVERLDTGDYLHVSLADPRFNIAINETCIIMERTVEWSQTAPAVIVLRLLETGLVPPEPATDQEFILLEDGSTVLLETSFKLELETSVQPETGFALLDEEGDALLLEDGSKMLLERIAL